VQAWKTDMQARNIDMQARNSEMHPQLGRVVGAEYRL
jgi:hypothetical protein